MSSYEEFLKRNYGEAAWGMALQSRFGVATPSGLLGSITLSLGTVGLTSIEVTASAASELHRSLTGLTSSWSKVTDLAEGQTYEDTGLSLATLYYYKAVARGGQVESNVESALTLSV